MLKERLAVPERFRVRLHERTCRLAVRAGPKAALRSRLEFFVKRGCSIEAADLSAKRPSDHPIHGHVEVRSQEGT